MELSLNFLTEEQLYAAQHDPDRYRYLMVRVFGLSAQSVNLAPELQETVIERVAAASRRR
jgi:formate C-acetyltransferase